MGKKIRFILRLLIFMLAAHELVFAQDGPVELPDILGALPEESPKSLFAWEGEKTSLEFFLKGTWTLSLTSTPTFGIGGSGLAFSFGGSPLLFSQQPDILLRMVLQKAFFFEASLVSEMSQSSLAMGYLGEESDFLTELRFGNSGLTFPEYPLLSFGPSGIDSPGLCATFGWGNDKNARTGNGHALLRFDSVQPERRSYIGKELVTERNLAASSFLSGRYFSLPDRGIANIAVYLRDGSGGFSDGLFSYRRLNDTDFSYSSTRGSLEILSGTGARGIVAYDRLDSLPISAQASERVTIEGREGTVVYDPGIRCESEILSRYDLKEIVPQTGRVEFQISSVTAGSLDSSIGSSWNAQTRILELYRYGLLDEKSPAARMPLSVEEPSIYAEGVLDPAHCPVSILVRHFETKDRYEIDAKAIPGTIKVKRNGLTETAFSYQPNSGYLELSQTVSDADRIDIEYLTPSSKTLTGNFVAGLSMDFILSERLSAYLALGSRWSMPWSKVSQADGMVGGDIGLTGGLSWKSEAWDGSMDLGAFYRRDDANDICRVDGMEDFLVTQPVVEGLWKRASAQAGFDEGSRVPLIFRDYLRTDLFGNQNLGSIDAIQRPAASDASARQGPYRASDSDLGAVAVAEYSFSGGVEWCGIQARLDASLLQNLVQADAIVVPIRFFHDIGALPEIGIQAGLLKKSPDDASGDSGTDDARHLSQVVPVAAVSGHSEWVEYEIPLSGDFIAAMRSGASVAIRISSASASSGRCAVGSLRLKGGRYLRDGASSQASIHVSQGYLDGPETVFPDDISTLRSDSSVNSYLRLSVSNSSSDVSVYRDFPLFPIESYAALSWYLRADSTSSPQASMGLSLRDSLGELVTASIPVGVLGSSWYRAWIDLDSSTAYLAAADGSRLAFPVRVIRNSAQGPVRLRWTLSGMEAGRVGLDELCFADARSGLEAVMNASASLKKTGSLLSIGSLPVISGLEASLGARLGLSNAFDYSGRAGAGLSLFPFVLSANAGLSGILSLSGASVLPDFSLGHRIGLPFPIGLLESLFNLSSGGDYSQKSRLNLSLASILDAQAEAQVRQEERFFSQSWKAQLGLRLPIENFTLMNQWSNRLSRESDVGSFDYGRAWLESYSLLFPLSPETSLSRGVSLDLGAQAARAQAGNNLDGSAHAAAVFENGLPSTHRSELSFQVSPLIGIGKEGLFRLKPEYSRSAVLLRPSAGASYGEDVIAWGETMLLMPDIWRAWPFVEFFDMRALSSLQALGFDPIKADLTAQTGLSLEHDSLGGSADFFIPSKISYTMKRLSSRIGSVSSEVLVHEAGLDFHSIDMFGNYGAFPLFRFLDNDEYIVKNTLSCTQPILGQSGAYQYALSMLCLWGLSPQLTLDIKDDLRAASTDELFSNEGGLSVTDKREAGQDWQERRQDLLEWLSGLERKNTIQTSSSLIEAWLTEQLFQVKRTSIAIKTAYNDEGVFVLAVPLSYESGLSMENRMSISANASMEAGWSLESGESRYSLGFAFSVKAKLEF
jgi:hypothetical protein